MCTTLSIRSSSVIPTLSTTYSPTGVPRSRASWGNLELALGNGCGFGSTSIELAERVGSQGSVTGVEISAIQKVLDGDLDPFIEASLKQGV